MSNFEEISFIKIGNILIVNFPKDLTDSLIERLQDIILQKIKETNAKGVIVDLKIVDFIDSYLGRSIIDIFNGINLLDVEAILVGINPFVALTVVELGVNMQNIKTASSVERGLKLIKVEISYENS